MAIESDKAVDRLTSSVLIGLGSLTGDPQVRAWALDHASEVDARWGGHEFGREVLRTVFGRALSDYFVRSGMTIPAENSTSYGVDRISIYSEKHLKVLGAVLRAFGPLEGAVEVEALDSPNHESGHIAAVASFD